MTTEVIYESLDLAHNYFDMKMYNKAEKVYKKLLRMGVRDKQIYYNLGQINSWNLLTDSAIKYYILASDYGYTDAFVDLIKIYYSKNDYDNMNRYSDLTIKSKDIYAIRKLVIFNAFIKNDDNVVQYLKYLVRLGDTKSMVLLGDYHRSKNDKINMEKNYIMAIENKEPAAMWYSLVMLNKA